MNQFWKDLILLMFYLEPEDPVVEEFVAYSSLFLELAAAIGVAVLVLVNEPLRKRKRPQDRLIFWECVLVFVMNVLYFLMFPLANYEAEWVTNALMVSITVYEVLYMLVILQWLICVDYSLYHSMDHIRRRYRYAAWPVLLLLVLHIFHSVLAYGIVETGEWGYYAQYILIILKRIIEFGYIISAIHLVHVYEKDRREPRFLRLDVFIIPFLIGVVFRGYDGPLVGLGVILTYVVMKRRDKYIDMDTGLFKAEYLDCICAHWDKKGYTDSNAMIVSAPENGDVLAKIMQDIRIMDCFIIRMDEDNFVILTGKLRSSATKMAEMTLLEETQQTEKPFIPVISSLERKEGQKAVEFAAAIKDALNGTDQAAKASAGGGG